MDCCEPSDYVTTAVTESLENLSNTSDADIMHTDIPLSSQPIDEIARYRNTFAVQLLMPEVFRLILLWGCANKKPDETFFEYPQREKNMSVRKLSKRHRLFKNYLK